MLRPIHGELCQVLSEEKVEKAEGEETEEARCSGCRDYVYDDGFKVSVLDLHSPKLTWKPI